MIVNLPAALFALSLLVAYGSAGRRRQLATIAMVGSTAWSLLLLAEPAVAVWAIGPVAATLLLPRPGSRVGSSFEGLTRRSIWLQLLWWRLIAQGLWVCLSSHIQVPPFPRSSWFFRTVDSFPEAWLKEVVPPNNRK